ncbi:hypothetical protein HR060_06475 [Catenovulum sp. SM1970]|uniref:hypothetical protein n=1 Tax=Marinifaba aquimaris TaxID=2741323 RepID=UPI001571C86D|nr:hypothetical protein [Marinifaba aquimaris]NTS76511.1 hypothetical protein [Marinifaba aquimaris]
MIKRYLTSSLFVLAMVLTSSAQASFINDSISVRYDDVSRTLINDTATVGNGVDFVGTDMFFRTFELDFTDNAFTLTISKRETSGNFTAIFSALEITGIDNKVLDVSFDAANSSEFTNNKQPDIEFSDDGRIELSTFLFLSANEPASALSHSFTWNVEFEPIKVSEPSALFILLLGYLGLAIRKD